MKHKLAGMVVLGLTLVAHAEDYDAVRASVARIQPTAEIEKIEPSALPGLVAVYAKEFDPIYMTLDGKRFIVGSVLEVTSSGKVIDLGADRKNAERATALSKVPAEDLIIFRPKGQVKAVVYVFTDVDCGYCRKLHSEIKDYTDAGIEIRYLAYPRGGLESETFGKMESVWCSKDRARAIGVAKSGAEVGLVNCSNPVANQFRLGKAIGVQGTPAIYTVDGRQIGGYLPAAAMKKSLQMHIE